MRTADWVLPFLMSSYWSVISSSTLVDPLKNVTEATSTEKEGAFFRNSEDEMKNFLTKTNEACSRGEISGCFKSSALASLDQFLSEKSYTLSEHARIVRTSRSDGARTVQKDSGSRSERNPDWSQFGKTLLTRVEAFVESAMIEVKLTDELTQNGRHEPRFIDEIASEIDALEDKNDNIFSRTKMKKLLIPLLLVLKVFKLKLLLFLPLILGLASFKKLIGFLVIALPAIIGFLKICKPDLSHSYGSSGHSSYYNLPPHRRYQLATGIYSRRGGPGVKGHPSRSSGDPIYGKDTFQYTSASYQNHPFNHYREAHPSEEATNERHHLAYNSYHVRK